MPRQARRLSKTGIYHRTQGDGSIVLTYRKENDIILLR